MKKFCVAMLLLCLMAINGFAETSQVTIADWLDKKGQCGECVMIVTVQEIINPVLAVVNDDTTSVNLFGLTVDGGFTNFIDIELTVGDVLTIQSPTYNEYEGTIEMADSVLIERVHEENKP